MPWHPVSALCGGIPEPRAPSFHSNWLYFLPTAPISYQDCAAPRGLKITLSAVLPGTPPSLPAGSPGDRPSVGSGCRTPPQSWRANSSDGTRAGQVTGPECLNWCPGGLQGPSSAGAWVCRRAPGRGRCRALICAQAPLAVLGQGRSQGPNPGVQAPGWGEVPALRVPQLAWGQCAGGSLICCVPQPCSLPRSCNFSLLSSGW